MSQTHILIFAAISIVLWAIPIARILWRAGYSPLWAIFAIVPFVGVIVLWITAFIRWPIDSRRA